MVFYGTVTIRRLEGPGDGPGDPSVAALRIISEPSWIVTSLKPDGAITRKCGWGNRTITGAGSDMTARDNFAASGEHQTLDSLNPAHELRKEYLPWSAARSWPGRRRRPVRTNDAL